MILTEPAIQAKFGRKLRARVLAAFLAEAATAVRLRGEVSVLLTTDAEIRRLNRTFRHKDQATDVLSFPADGAVGVAGDLAISVETADRQATEAGHALSVECQVLLLHGVLHLAGYDHETDAGQMARREATLRKRFGLSAGLIERSGEKAEEMRRRPGMGQPTAAKAGRSERR
jgi:probable rRNA maturation factor